MMITGQELVMGVVADLLAGDPRWLPHPVCGIGTLARQQERWWRASGLPMRAAGIGAWCGVLAATVAVVVGTVYWLPSPWIQVYWIYSFLALRSLDQHALSVVRALRASDMETARCRVGYMVGRDTAELDETGVARAMIETVAENASDGIVAPLFWLLIGGPVAMAAYKAINTLDSMFGYKNERYGEFGWWAARVDDWANWLPARITALLFWAVAASSPCMNLRRSFACTLRDAHRQPSPNSGYPEAAAAGALGIQLGGVNYYRGVRSEKAPLGDPVYSLGWQRYSGMRALLYASALVLVAVAVGVLQWQ